MSSGALASWRHRLASTSELLKGMSVIASDGDEVGHVETSSATRITLRQTTAVGVRNRQVPKSWIIRIDDQVHLNRPSAEVLRAVSGESAEAPKGVVGSRSPFFWILVVAFGTVFLLLIARACVGSYDRAVAGASVEARSNETNLGSGAQPLRG